LLETIEIDLNHLLVLHNQQFRR